MAVWALGQLGPREEVLRLASRHRAREIDADVRGEWQFTQEILPA